MSDTIEGLQAELEKEQRVNNKILDLLLKVQGAMPDEVRRLAPLIDRAKATKEILDNCEKILTEKSSRQ